MDGQFCELAQVSVVEKAIDEHGNIVDAIEMPCDQIDALKDVCGTICRTRCALTIENVIFERYRGLLTNTKFLAIVINRELLSSKMTSASVLSSSVEEP